MGPDVCFFARGPRTSPAQGAGSGTVGHPHVQAPVRPSITPGTVSADAIKGLLITYKGVFAATTKFTLQRAMAGRRAADRLRISGQVPAGTLTAGTYRLRSLFTDANGIRHAFYTFFKVTSSARHPARRHAGRR